jgi:crotonobetainyl-CoA:carnitine CoA-transferase CaiB-like acyl-CoA transferase
MTKALKGVRILDFTHVQSGPTCTQLLAWFGADVIKVERPGVGDITRGQLQDVPNVDSLYFTMLNHNKRSITLDTKNPKGKEVLTALIKSCDVLVENFGPGVLDRMGFPWEKIQGINPKMIVASIKGFGPGPYEDCKVYENVAQCTGGSASTTGTASASNATPTTRSRSSATWARARRSRRSSATTRRTMVASVKSPSTISRAACTSSSTYSNSPLSFREL